MNTHISICKGGLERSWTPPTHGGCVFYMSFGFMKWLLSDFFFLFFFWEMLYIDNQIRGQYLHLSHFTIWTFCFTTDSGNSNHQVTFTNLMWQLQREQSAGQEKKMCLFYMLAHTNNLLERTRVHSRSIWKPLQSRGLMRAETTLGESYQLEVPLSQREAAVMEGSRADSEVTRRVQLLMDFMLPHCSTHWIYKLTCKER